MQILYKRIIFGGIQTAMNLGELPPYLMIKKKRFPQTDNLIKRNINYKITNNIIKNMSFCAHNLLKASLYKVNY